MKTFLNRRVIAPLRSARVSVLRALSASGTTKRVLDSAWRQERLAILCYHGISKRDEHCWRPSLYMTQDKLAERLGLLRSWGCTVLPLAEAIERLYSRTLPPRSVALTFDDGAHDFLSRALPILEDFNVPSTVYVSTWYVGRPDWPVFPVALSYMLWRSKEVLATSSNLDSLYSGGEQGRDPEDITRKLLHQASVEKWSGADKQSFLERLGSCLSFDFEEMMVNRQLCLMSASELSSLPSSVSLQLHTHTHVTPDNEDQLRREIELNRKELNALGRLQTDPLTHFCYPSGIVHDQQPAWLSACGIRSATTCEVSLATPNDDPLLLPRIIDTTTMTSAEFEGWISGPRGFLRF